MTPPPSPSISEDDIDYHERQDPHRRAGEVSEVILGAQDGLVNVLGVVLGVAASTGNNHVVLVAGLATTFAESISMAAVAFTSSRANAAHFEAERKREYRHLRKVPALEKEEVREIYRSKGFEGDLLNQIVETITHNPDVWVALMMAEEHRIAPVSHGESLRASWVVGLASLVGSLFPLVPFLFFAPKTSMAVAVAAAGAALFAIGIYKAKRTVGKPWRSGLELLTIGLMSAVLGYAIGAIFQVPV
ncbi:MAG: VIT1/CCC1 transporter family protein [Myxococcaceae bacterium]|nr:VIT1/CCC1 transporter family protein [Myxococcaceae bacterium]